MISIVHPSFIFKRARILLYDVTQRYYHRASSWSIPAASLGVGRSVSQSHRAHIIVFVLEHKADEGRVVHPTSPIRQLWRVDATKNGVRDSCVTHQLYIKIHTTNVLLTKLTTFRFSAHSLLIPRGTLFSYAW